jgi:hypothetical protein
LKINDKSLAELSVGLIDKTPAHPEKTTPAKEIEFPLQFNLAGEK